MVRKARAGDGDTASAFDAYDLLYLCIVRQIQKVHYLKN